MQEREPEKVVNVEGPKGESVFHYMSSGVIQPGHDPHIQSRIDSMVRRAEGLKDDRLLVLVGALIIENAVDGLLAAIIPGYRVLRDGRDFTFSMRIRLAEALRLIPSRILHDADLIRKVRNEFVHDLSVDTFDKLKPSMLESMCERVSKYNPHIYRTHADTFKRLVSFVAIALYGYEKHASKLNDFIRRDNFLSTFEKIVNRQDEQV